MKITREREASFVIIGAVVTTLPRWIAANLAADGLTIPASWLTGWIILTALLSAGMAVVEAAAFHLAFSAWREAQPGRIRNALMTLITLSALAFVAFVAPIIAANAQGVTLAAVLTWAGAPWFWAACVASSTILIVATTGVAQSASKTQSARPEAQPAEVHALTPAALPALGTGGAVTCERCGRTDFANRNALSAHKRWCKRVGA